MGVWGDPGAGDEWALGALEPAGRPTEPGSLWAAEPERAWLAVLLLLPLLLPPLCLGELLALPGLTGRTGKGPHVLAAGEKVPPNCAMGSRGCLIWCMVWAASRAS